MNEYDVELAAARSRMREAGEAVFRAARGTLVKWGVGIDPDVTPSQRWWARAHLMLGRAVRPITVVGYGSGPDAAEALADRVADVMRQRAARSAGRTG